MNKIKHNIIILLCILVAVMGVAIAAQAGNVIHVKPFGVKSKTSVPVDFYVLFNFDKAPKAFQFDMKLDGSHFRSVSKVIASSALTTSDTVYCQSLNNGIYRVFYKCPKNTYKKSGSIKVTATLTSTSYLRYSKASSFVINVSNATVENADSASIIPQTSSFFWNDSLSTSTGDLKFIPTDSILSNLSHYVPSTVCEALNDRYQQETNVTKPFYPSAYTKPARINLSHLDSIGSAIIPGDPNQLVYCPDTAQIYQTMKKGRAYNVVGLIVDSTETGEIYKTYESPCIIYRMNNTDFDASAKRKLSKISLDNNIYAREVEYKRDFNGKWATVCLPMALDSSAVTYLEKKQKIRFYGFVNLKDTVQRVWQTDTTYTYVTRYKAFFSKAKELMANKPYIVEFIDSTKSTHQLCKFGYRWLYKNTTGSGDGAEILRTYCPGSTGNYLQGTYSIGTSFPVYSFGFDESNGQFRKITGSKVTIYPFRAYMYVTSKSMYSKASVFDLAFDDEVIEDAPTPVEEVKVTKTQRNVNDGIWYNIHGQRVGHDAKGIVIINNKKYFIK